MRWVDKDYTLYLEFNPENGNRTAGYKGDRECRQSGERQLECGNGTDACIHSGGRQ